MFYLNFSCPACFPPNIFLAFLKGRVYLKEKLICLCLMLFHLAQPNFFFPLRIICWSSDVVDCQKWKSHLPSKKSPDPTKRHALTLRWPPQGACLKLWAWEKWDRVLCPFTRGQQLNTRQHWILTLCQGSVLSPSPSFIWQLVPESLCVSAFLPKHHWSSDIMEYWGTEQKQGREISGVFELDQRHAPFLHVNLHPTH